MGQILPGLVVALFPLSDKGDDKRLLERVRRNMVFFCIKKE